MTAVLLMLAMWIIIMRDPKTPIAKMVWRLTVTHPGAWLRRLQRRHWIAALLVGVAAAVVLAWIGKEGVQLLAMAAPDAGTWLMTFEIGTYVDAAVAVVAAASVVRLRGARLWWMTVRVGLRRWRSAAVGRARRTRRIGLPAANDDDRPELLVAA